MRVLHFSITPLAGMPVRLVQALNRHTGVDARLVDLKRFGLYDHDLVFVESPEEALDLAWEADVIHLHNYLDYGSKAFGRIDFGELARAGKRIVRQFHSSPDLVAQVMGITPEALLAQDIPAIAIAQYPERLYPKAMVVPNFVPETDEAYLPTSKPPRWDVFYSPTKDLSAWADRWSTKGMPEATAVIEGVAKRTGCRAKIITGLPLAEALALKRASRIVVDDLVTGSYHLTGLEGLAQGKCVLSFLDERSLALLRHFSGADAHPFVNVRLEDAAEALEYLVREPELTRELGAQGRRWLNDHWPEECMVRFYEHVYELLLEDPDLVRRQPEFSLESDTRYFLFRTLPDLTYRSRAKRWTMPA
ncbi:glycosyltransferase family 1 protein [Fundidesulfovibrio terrae]|uniref:glycosyltransferase family 1 protein n=1 Tax=Fundidesulfovibrio terrae TaxID=2922866 RepID=UPI001FAEBFF2|nr:glycosyltransferase family 1 protein [Fundidesulfovibrio terrae]